MDIAAPERKLQQPIQVLHIDCRYHCGQIDHHTGLCHSLKPLNCGREGGGGPGEETRGVVRGYTVQTHTYRYLSCLQLLAELRGKQGAVGLKGGLDLPPGGPPEVQHLRRRIPTKQGLPAGKLNMQAPTRRAGQGERFYCQLRRQIRPCWFSLSVAVGAVQITAVGKAQNQGV